MKLYLFLKHIDKIDSIEPIEGVDMEAIKLPSNITSSELPWDIFINLVEKSYKLKDKEVLFCTDLTVFNPALIRNVESGIELAKNLNANLILFNAKYVNKMLPVSPYYFWVDCYAKSQIFLLNESFLPKILANKNEGGNSVDHILSKITSNKILYNPMLAPTTDHEFSVLSKRMRLISSKFTELKANQHFYNEITIK